MENKCNKEETKNIKLNKPMSGKKILHNWIGTFSCYLNKILLK